MPDSQNTFNPTRLTLARRRRGWNKGRVASAIGVDLRSVSAYESEEYPPSPETLERLAGVLKFPTEFFFGPTMEDIISDAASFRSLSKMKAYQRDMALSQGAIALHFNKWIEARFELPAPDVPDLSSERSPQAAAESLRQYWGLGQMAIRNMLHLLEAKGIRVFSLSVDSREVDAFSLWKDTTPLIFLNCIKSSEHSRYDAAHELGHLVLHRHATPHGREAEREADIFASAFLMPRGSVLAKAYRYPSFSDLVKLKKSWMVSVAALNRRLHELEMLSDWEYRKLCIQIAKHDRNREPESGPRETSQVFVKIFEALHRMGISRWQVAKELFVYQSELEELMFGLALTAVEGGRKKTPAARSQPSLIDSNQN